MPVTILGTILAIAVAVLLIIFLIVPIFKGLAYVIGYTFGGIVWLIAHIFRFVAGMITDALRIVGAVITSLFFIPFILGTVVIGRWSASAHYGRALQHEIGTIGRSFYRLCIGHLAQLLMLGGLTEGIEQRLPAAMAQAPGADRPSKRSGSFDGYTIVGSLKGGGSGGKLYVAEPDERKRLAFARAAGEDIDQVVIKSFSLHEGSSLPQIIRESRALEAAKKLGLVLEHDLTDERFYYVMPYVPGDSLTAVSQRLHSQGDAEGLSTRDMRFGVGLIADLLTTLDVYHRGGLWHKDVKPDNIIVHESHAHLVDLGLVTPLRSAMTLTTHGTEYFRDPEMVRMALRGAKVHEVNGVKFDIYGTGAVLFALLENSFPAHGGLSQLRKRCPEALRWVIRRAMAEMSQRYVSAGQMLADVRAVIDADDPFALKPKDLPSMADGAAPVALEEPEIYGELPVFASPSEAAGPPVGAGFAAAQAAQDVPVSPQRKANKDVGRRRPQIKTTDFWTGRYRVDGEGKVASVKARAGSPAPQRAAARSQLVPVGMRKSAAEQRKHAQQRVQKMQDRVQSRMRGHGRNGRKSRYSSSPNMGVGVAFLFLLGVAVLFALVFPLAMGFRGMDFESAFSSSAALGEGEFDVVFNESDGNARTLRIRTAMNDEVTVTRVATVESSPRILALPADGMVSGLDRVERALQRLQRDGFMVLGPGADDATQTIIAEALKEIGPGARPDDDEARTRLRTWLDSGGAGLDGVLLVGTGEEAGQIGLITATGVEARPIIDAMGTAFNVNGDAITTLRERVMAPDTPKAPKTPSVELESHKDHDESHSDDDDDEINY